MSLYLCVFQEDEELDGVAVGTYADFGAFRNAVVSHLEGGVPGDKYPTLLLHSDCEGEWSIPQCKELERELRSISAAFRKLPPSDFGSDWQEDTAKLLGLRPKDLYESFIDVDGEPLLERLLSLCRLALDHQQPILFQ